MLRYHQRWKTLTQTLDCLTADHAFMKGSYCHVVCHCELVLSCFWCRKCDLLSECSGSRQSLAQPLCAKYLVNDDYQNDRKMIHCWVWKHRRTCRQTEFSACFRFSCRFNLRGVGGVVMVYWGLFTDNHCGEPPAAWLSCKYPKCFSSYSLHFFIF